MEKENAITRAEEIAQAEHTPVTPKRLAKALRTVLEYNWRDEEEDFLGGEHEAAIDEHIFGSLIVLDQYAKRLKTSVPNEARKGWLILFRSTLHKYGLAFILRGLRRSYPNQTVEAQILHRAIQEVEKL